MIDPDALGLKVTKIVGNEARCLCPFHDDHTPSASFNMVKGVFWCHTCQTSVKSRSLAEYLGGVVMQTQTPAGRQEKPFIPEEREWKRFLEMPLATICAYLHGRDITLEMIQKFEIRYSPTQSSVLFPLYSKKKTVIGFNRRFYGKDTNLRYRLYGQRPPAWPYHLLRNQKTVFLTEGIFDCLRMRIAGLENTFAILSTSNLDKVIKAFNGRHVITVFDKDFAGCLAAAKLHLALNAQNILLPYDLDDVPIEDIPFILADRGPAKQIDLLINSGKHGTFKRLLRKWRVHHKV